MLGTTRKEVKLSNASKVGDLFVENYNATIDTSNLQNVQITSYISDQASYKENRALIRADRAKFEDEVYALQDEMIAEQNTQGGNE
ncbi:MAG: hypothetical protein E6357_28900 [Clostridiales bacterium]|nr:hypothetical protein [Clostridiales bacterium]